MMRFSQQLADAHNARIAAERFKKLGGHIDIEDLADREADLHEQIFSECRRRRWIAFHGAMSERTNRTLGEPDFIILANGGRVFFVECKSRSGKLGPEQQAIAHAAKALGHEINVVRSFREFLFLLMKGGELLDKAAIPIAQPKSPKSKGK